MIVLVNNYFELLITFLKLRLKHSHIFFMMPQISSALNGWESPILLIKISYTDMPDGSTVLSEIPINFKGTIQPLKTRNLEIHPTEGRAFTWLQIHTRINIALANGDRVKYKNVKYKVMNLNDYSLNGYYEYHLCEEFQN